MSILQANPLSLAFKPKVDPLRVGIQGVRASFHDLAARIFFSTRNIEAIQCPSFPRLCKDLREKCTDAGVMAIENSIAGSILPNYSLLEANHFKIIGELYLRIEMNLMALPGQKIEDIRFVQSHPMALLQCENFFLAHPEIKILEGSDTAESAEELRNRNLKGYAAIASRLAAETYGLEVLEQNIETNKQNYTRFLVICRAEDYLPTRSANKASIRFEVPDRPGSLVQILEIFHRYSVNMTKLQSVVIPERPYEYSFHVDLEWKRQKDYDETLALLGDKVLNLIHFGVYTRCMRPTV